jgi:hypothetical protein
MLGNGFRRLGSPAGFTGFADFLVTFFQLVELFIGKLLDVDKIVVRRVMRADKFVQLQVQGFSVPVLRVLDEKYDEKSNDGSAGIYDELPGIREMEEWPAHGPQYQHNHGKQEHIRMPDHVRCLAGKSAEPQV